MTLGQHGRCAVVIAAPPLPDTGPPYQTHQPPNSLFHTADKVSREDEKWGHGAFTKALLDALSATDDVDTNHDGVISMSELTAYMDKRLTELTGGDQQLGLDQRFQGDIFVAGL